jgi:thiol-disulfide isomerase/thioredoxin
MDKIIKIFIAIFVIIAVVTVVFVTAHGSAEAATATSSSTPAITADDSVVYYFYGQGCPHCAAIEPFMENMTKKYPDVNIRKLEVWYNTTNEQIYDQVNAAAGISSPSGVPEIVIGNVVLVGQQEIPDKLEGYLQAIEKKKVNTAQ